MVSICLYLDISRDLCMSCATVTFDPSQGQLATVIYEWSDVEYLGKVTSMVDDALPVSNYATQVLPRMHPSF